MPNLSLRNIHVEEFALPMYLNAATVAADIGKGVTQDTSAAMTVRLAEDGEEIFGFLDTFEDRGDFKLGAVQQKGGFGMTYEGAVPNIGDGMVGSTTPGVLRTTGAAATAGQPRVFKVDTAKNLVEVYLA